jgi:hypothetical protein
VTVLSTGNHSRGWADFLAAEFDRHPLPEAMRSASIYAKRRSFVASALAKRASMGASVSANRWSVVASRALISDRGSAMSALATTAPSRAAASAFTILCVRTRPFPALSRRSCARFNVSDGTELMVGRRPPTNTPATHRPLVEPLQPAPACA